MTTTTTITNSTGFNFALLAGEVLTRLRVLGVPVPDDTQFGSTTDPSGRTTVILSLAGLPVVSVEMETYGDGYRSLAKRLAEETYRQYELSQAPDPVEDFS